MEMAFIRLKFVLFWIILGTWLFGQNNTGNTYYPAQIKSYGIEEGLPDPCVSFAHIDSLGKLTIIPCGHAQITYNMPFYQLDGFKARFNDFSKFSKFKYGYLYSLGVTSNEINYGIIIESQAFKGFYTYNLISGDFEEYELPDFGNEVLALGNVLFTEGQFELLIYNREFFHIAILQQGDIQIKRSFQNPFNQPLLGGKYPFLKLNDEYFFSDRDNIFKTQKDSLIVLMYNPDYQKMIMDSTILDLFVFQDGIISTTAGMPKKSYYLDTKSGSYLDYNNLIPDDYDGDFLNTMVFEDEKGQLLTVMQYKDGSFKSFVRETNGQVSDYSAVIQAFNSKDFRVETFSSLYSKDFTKQIIKVAYNFEIIDVTSNQGISSIDLGAQRGIIELNDGNLYVSGDNKIVFDEQTIRVEQNVFEEINESLFDGAISRLNDSEFIIPSQRWLMIYNELDQSFKKIDFDQIIVRYLYLEDKDVILVNTIEQAFEIDVQSGEVSQLELVELPGYISQIYQNQDQLFFVTNSGIYKGEISVDRKLSFELLDPQLNIAANMMAKDSRGRYWIATFSKGLYIFDPETDHLDVVDMNKGLSNNTIATLIQDDDGDFWIGTFNGITIIDESLNILGHVYESDGLNNNECNRWSVFKKRDGTLVFGSTKGLSLIDPAVYKDKLKNTPSFKIYLSEILYRDSLLIDDLSILNSPFYKSIKLPASNRNIKISYGVSDYANPANASYAYKLEGKSNDWNYIGNIHELSLIDLPRGKYNILIKGTNYRGQPTINNLSVPVYVGSYFYQTWWFYLLCALLLTTGIFAWILRQKRIQLFLEEEVRKRTSTIQKQTEELKELDQLKSKLYTNITHEFRTPLTVIDGLSDQINKDPKASEIIKRNTKNLLSLVNQMLDLRKLESGKMNLNMVQADIVSYVKYIGESFTSIAHSKGISIQYHLPDDNIIMDFDPDKITRIVGNLISNAIKYTPENGEVNISVSEVEEALKIEVEDNGIGIPEEQIPHIFSQYYQVDNELTRTGMGTGIGLTLVYELIQVLGGSIRVKSQEDVGSSFLVTLPITNDATFTEVIGKESVIKMTSSMPVSKPSEIGYLIDVPEHSGKPTILLVEDNHDVLHYLILCLKDDYNIKIANNGREGLDQALKWVPSIIVSDVMMPEMTGYELCEEVKKDIRISHIPIILLTAKADDESKLKGLQFGADEYLKKPFDKEELLVRLNNLIKFQKAMHIRYNTFSELSESTNKLLKREDDFILSFREMIKDEIENEQFGVPEMCKYLGMGKTQLHEKLKSLTGKTPIQYQRMIKIHEAKLLLVKSEISISEIAFNLGFRDPKYFSKVFKEEAGMTPTDYQLSKQ